MWRPEVNLAYVVPWVQSILDFESLDGQELTNWPGSPRAMPMTSMCHPSRLPVCVLGLIQVLCLGSERFADWPILPSS